MVKVALEAEIKAEGKISGMEMPPDPTSGPTPDEPNHTTVYSLAIGNTANPQQPAPAAPDPGPLPFVALVPWL